MKIALDSGGSYLEPDGEPRNTQFHKRIVRTEKLHRPGMKSDWHHVTLECGHSVTCIGKLERVDGVVLCAKCRDLNEGEEQHERKV